MPYRRRRPDPVTKDAVMTAKTIARWLTALAVTAAATAAPAHIVFAQPGARAGSYYPGFLIVSHGCAGSATVSLRVVIPETVTIARPQPKPGWTLAVETVPLATPMRSESGGVTRERVAAITWTGRLDADRFDQFGILVKLPATPGTLYFPTVQRCATGHNDWTMIPAAGQPPHSVKMPAPALEVTGADDAMGPMPM